jgi:c-di-GMP-binding flagellar brake protein YcgR
VFFSGVSKSRRLSGGGVGIVSVTEERRKWPRIPAEHLVSYARFDEHGELDQRGMARTLDLSEGGMVLEMTHPANVGEHLQIGMVSGDQILRANAAVVYSKPLPAGRWRVGVSFKEIPEEDVDAITQEVAKFRQRGDRG